MCIVCYIRYIDRQIADWGTNQNKRFFTAQQEKQTLRGEQYGNAISVSLGWLSHQKG